MTIRAPSVEDRVAEALHRAKAVGGPWRPCGPAFACDCRSMARHLLAELSDCGAVQWAQDALDGAALRRLREALPDETGPSWFGAHRPEGWSIEISAAKTGEWNVEVFRPSREYQPAPHVSVYGATIAEAADKCREALT